MVKMRSLKIKEKKEGFDKFLLIRLLTNSGENGRRTFYFYDELYKFLKVIDMTNTVAREGLVYFPEERLQNIYYNF